MTLEEKIYDLSAIWRHAAFVFPHFHRCAVNWDEAYREFIPRAIATKSDREHCLLMSEFVNLLGDGHTDVSFRREITDEIGYLPFALDYAQGCYWTEGQRILGFDGRPMEEILKEASKYVYHVGLYLPRLRYILPMILGEGEHTLETEAGSRRFSYQKERPQLPQNRETEFALHGDVLRIIFDDLLRNRAPEIRERLMERKPGAVILDIRENIGGMTKFGADIAQLFISGKFGGCKKWTRTMTGVGYASASQVVNMSEAELAAVTGKAAREEIEKSRRIAKLSDFEEYEDQWGEEGTKAVFDGPVVVLTSRKTVSAAEDFAAFFRTNSRAILIGQSTCGTTGTPLLKGLHCGTLRVCSVGYTLRDGTEFLGKGILPDRLSEDPVADALKHLK